MVNMTYDIIFVYNSILAEVMKLQSSLVTELVRHFNKLCKLANTLKKFKGASWVKGYARIILKFLPLIKEK